MTFTTYVKTLFKDGTVTGMMFVKIITKRGYFKGRIIQSGVPVYKIYDKWYILPY